MIYIEYLWKKVNDLRNVEVDYFLFYKKNC